jgi:hypothetical protein
MQYFNLSELLLNGFCRSAKINFSSNTDELINIIRECVAATHDYSSKDEV